MSTAPPDPEPVDPAVEARQVAEAAIRASIVAGELRAAATATIQLYGTEIFGFLRAMARHDDVAAEAFAQLGEDLWRGLPKFRWDTSLRSWSYTLARNALFRLHRHAGRVVPLSDSDAAQLAVHLRTATAEYQRTEVKDALRALRDDLPPDDHELILLRLDRQMSWKDIARIHGGDDDLTVRAAALRKRFARAKDRLRALALARGLLGR